MQRIKEIDFTKGLLILLVISFHLVYIEHLYPYAKQVVYTFHMPAFLVISGYLMKTGKAPGAFWRSLLWLAVPYLVMESGYTVMAARLPINEHIDKLTAQVFLDKLLLHPIGPYWYLHTLLQCEAVVYCAMGLRRLSSAARFVLATLVLYLAADVAGTMAFSSALYFLAGAVMRHAGLSMAAVCRPSLLALAAFAVLAAQEGNLNRATLAGAVIVYMSVCSCFLLFRHSADGVRRALQFLGRYTMPLYLFHPVFTILCKPLAPVLAFDPTGMLFLLVALTACVAGSLLIAFVMDKTRLSRLMFGRRIFNDFVKPNEQKNEE